MAAPHEDARADLHDWASTQPENFFSSNRQLRRLSERLMGSAAYSERRPHLESFGGVVAGPLDRAAIVNNRPWNLPRLARWSDLGDRIESIEHHPTFQDCGHAIYQDGRVIAVYADRPANVHAQALFYLSSHAGEAGHNCPVACTAGVVKTLQAIGSTELKARYLPGLLSDVFPDRLDGAQFLTEVQGGSDVGSNSVVAEPDGTAMGTSRWRLTGEKWFCSNADADLILMTARVTDTDTGAEPKGGTPGLGLFLVPRRLDDGSPNHYALRRLKDKLGTRSMPSAEIDFNGAIGYAVGPPADGFKNVMTNVINTSRLYNTVGCAGLSARAFYVADAYARHRRAFGQPIGEFPLVQEMIANMRSTVAAMTAGCLELASHADQGEAGALDEAGRAFLRVAVNLAKMRSCQHSHRVILTAIETLGGNGAIESFSVLPRLLRDNVVYENWEGTHNTLVAQTLRDFARSRLHEGFLATLEPMLTGADDALGAALAPARAAVDAARAGLGEALAHPDDPGLAALMLRPHCERLADAVFAGAYAMDIASESDPARRAGETQVLAWFCARHLAPNPPRRDPAYAAAASAIARLATR